MLVINLYVEKFEKIQLGFLIGFQKVLRLSTTMGTLWFHETISVYWLLGIDVTVRGGIIGLIWQKMFIIFILWYCGLQVLDWDLSVLEHLYSSWAQEFSLKIQLSAPADQRQSRMEPGRREFMLKFSLEPPSPAVQTEFCTTPRGKTHQHQCSVVFVVFWKK